MYLENKKKTKENLKPKFKSLSEYECVGIYYWITNKQDGYLGFMINTLQKSE